MAPGTPLSMWMHRNTKCPRQRLVRTAEQRQGRGRRTGARTWPGMAGNRAQPIDGGKVFNVGKLGTTTDFPLREALGDPIYKICTLVSTGFVEKGGRAGNGAPRKASIGAVSSPVPRSPPSAGHDGGHPAG